jgi:F-type H+-transporting ATPase subunit alpha
VPSHEPDVPSILRALRERLADLGPVHQQPRDAVQRIKDEVVGVSGLPTPGPEVESLLRNLRQRTAALPAQVRFYDVGTVQRVGNGVATLSGLPRARTDELVVFPTGVRGMVLNLDHESIDVILLGSDKGLQGGDLVTGTGRRLRVPVGRALLGRVVNALGEPLDGRGPVQETEFRHLERDAPGIIQRAAVNVPLHAGTKLVDALVPIGRGQRELIIGDRQIGKTTLALDAILSQKDSGVLCVYVAVGQKKSSSLEVITALRRHDALAYSVVVLSGPDEPPALRYLAPYAGCTMAESLMDAGHDVLVIYDDLSKHADAYRELSLLLRRPPGREAYPGDIFYLHARLLERACKLAPEAGGGSLTALPIVETRSGNISAYIPTNLIAITDGQIVLDTNLFNRGTKPAVNVGLSVSRVGGAAQSPAMRKLAAMLRLDLAQYEEVARFARFGAEVDETTRYQIRRGERLRAVLNQPPNQPQSLAGELVILLAVTQGFLDDVPVADIPSFEDKVLDYVQAKEPDLYYDLERTGEWQEGMQGTLQTLFAEYSAIRSRQGSAL